MLLILRRVDHFHGTIRRVRLGRHTKEMDRPVGQPTRAHKRGRFSGTANLAARMRGITSPVVRMPGTPSPVTTSGTDNRQVFLIRETDSLAHTKERLKVLVLHTRETLSLQATPGMGAVALVTPGTLSQPTRTTETPSRQGQHTDGTARHQAHRTTPEIALMAGQRMLSKLIAQLITSPCKRLL